MKTPIIVLGTLISTLGLIAASTFFCASTSADELRIPVSQQAADKQHMNKPKNGQTKQQVQEKFGDPDKQNGAVGDPPISSWEYADYIVYFEYDKVLHAVLKGSARPAS